MFKKKSIIATFSFLTLVVFAGQSLAAMGGRSGMMPGGTGVPGTGSVTGMMTGSVIGAGSGMMGGNGAFGNGSMMGGSAGSFGMTNGMSAAPVVGEDGTAYLTSYVSTNSDITTPVSASFQSTILAVTPSGQTSTLKLDGIVSRPIVSDGFLVATMSLPNAGNYMVVGSQANNTGVGQSVLYAVPLPITSSSKPVAITLDGGYASVPVIVNNRIYVTTTDFGNAMMGSGAFTSMFGNYNFNNQGTAKTFLYIFNADDGTLASKTEIP
jgi:hypothetical protein